MTVTFHPSLEALAGTDIRSASWWASVARALDDLDDRLAQEPLMDAPIGGAGQIGDGPLSVNAVRLRDDHARLTERARRLRRLVAEVAGDDHQAAAVAGELAALAEAEDRYRYRAGALLGASSTRGQAAR